MNGMNDFEIENGVLVKYTGTESRVEIPSSVVSIADFAFKGCSCVRSVVIPASVNSIGHYAIADCCALEELAVNEGNRKYCSRGNCVIDKQENTLVLGCQSSVIPDDGSVTDIERFAFASCVSLESIIIPGTVKQIRDYAFDGCYNLDSVTIIGSVNPEVYWHGPLDYIGSHAFAGCERLDCIVIPQSVSCIGDKAFFECKNLKSVTVSDSLDFIGIDAFGGCNEALVICAPKDSYAEEYAKENGIKVKTI